MAVYRSLHAARTRRRVAPLALHTASWVASLGSLAVVAHAAVTFTEPRGALWLACAGIVLCSAGLLLDRQGGAR